VIRGRAVSLAGAGLGTGLLLLTAGCGAGGHSTAAGGDAGGATTDSLSSKTANGGFAQESAARAAGTPSPGDTPDVRQPAVISTGHIALASGDVADVRSRLDVVLARTDGRVADEDTTTDDHGTVTSSHLVVRVPSSRFDEAMTSLEVIASLRSSSRKAEDVTTRVIDVKARIAAERAGVRRLRHLVGHTASLPALLEVERALTQRQGELESLMQQRAFLHDQTSLATISVDVTRRTPAPTPPEASAGGFVGGLGHGWHALVAVVVGLLVGVGALLPFAVAGALVGLPSWLVVRRMRRTRRLRTPV
jgi:hypothetical protein